MLLPLLFLCFLPSISRIHFGLLSVGDLSSGAGADNFRDFGCDWLVVGRHWDSDASGIFLAG